jgi:ribose/xylose/arabinose/galactoside ABC-type transport system permease subunit
MAFDDSSQSTSAYPGTGYEYVPPRRDTTSSFDVLPVAPLATAATETDPTVSVPPRPAPNLDLVFDDPADGEPGRDRIMVHGLWELVLALALAGAGYLLYQADSAAFGAGGLRELLFGTTVLGLLGAGMALSLRAGVPNLAVGGVAAAASVYFGQHFGSGLTTALLLTLAICAGVGLVQGLVVVGLQVPAWAAGLGVGLGLFAWLAGQGAVRLTGGYDPLPHAYYWFGGFCALSLIASVVGLVPVIRRGFGRFRPVVDPARRRGTVAALIAVAATVGSSVLAGTAGVLTVLVARTATASDGLELTALALGVALLGGTSAFGRRGGIFGTIFAAGLLAVALSYGNATDRTWPAVAYAAAAIGVGLAVTRLVERFGRPSLSVRTDTEESWMPKSHALAPVRGNSWPATTTPATPAAGGLWASDDAWGTIEPR